MSITVGRLMGVPLRIHWTWFLAFGLLSYLIGHGFVAVLEADISSVRAIGVGAFITLALYACLIAHECAHAATATKRGIAVSEISLSAMGGEARLARDARNWSEELFVAAAGPAVSGALALGFAIPLVLFEQSGIVAIIAFYLAFANAVLALMNLLPGSPLDGGRALRAILWRATGSRTRAGRIATGAGECIGGALAVYGAVLLVTADWNGLWFVGLGWYIADAAAREWERERVRIMLEHAHASDVLTGIAGASSATAEAVVDADENAWQVVERMGELDENSSVAVAETGRIIGVIQKRELTGLLTARLRTASL